MTDVHGMPEEAELRRRVAVLRDALATRLHPLTLNAATRVQRDTRLLGLVVRRLHALAAKTAGGDPWALMRGLRRFNARLLRLHADPVIAGSVTTILEWMHGRRGRN